MKERRQPTNSPAGKAWGEHPVLEDVPVDEPGEWVDHLRYPQDSLSTDSLVQFVEYVKRSVELTIASFFAPLVEHFEGTFNAPGAAS